MYLNNVGFRAIGRIMNIPFQIIHGWIRNAGVEKEVKSVGKSPSGWPFLCGGLEIWRYLSMHDNANFLRFHAYRS